MKPVVDQLKCNGCGTCLNCPAGLFVMKDGKSHVKEGFKEGDCLECYYCEQSCPQKAIKLK